MAKKIITLSKLVDYIEFTVSETQKVSIDVITGIEGSCAKLIIANKQDCDDLDTRCVNYEVPMSVVKDVEEDTPFIYLADLVKLEQQRGTHIPTFEDSIRPFLYVLD